MVTRAAKINACGPFPHSYFEFGGERVSQEGPLEGRADFLVGEALDFLQQVCEEHRVSKRKLQILEVGSYDGWVAHKLWEAGFRNIFTLEPRRHNIERGKRLRRLLGDRDRVRHLKGTLASPPLRLRWRALLSRRFDVLISFGVIHHLDDPVGFVRSARRFCRRSVLLEGVTVPDKMIDDKLVSAIEPKDIIYANRPRNVSLFGVKLESEYYPGSRMGVGPVLIPGVTAFVWALEAAGFTVTSAKQGFEWARDLSETHRQNLSTTVFRADVGNSGYQVKSNFGGTSAVVAEEVLNCRSILSDEVLEKIQSAASRFGTAYHPKLQATLSSLSSGSQNPTLILNIIHAPRTKLAFERAKRAVTQGERESAVAILRGIVDSPCDDWRSAYRAFFLLSELDVRQKKAWRRLLKMTNPEFPEEEVREAPWNFSD